jgi:hypothetical protein
MLRRILIFMVHRPWGATPPCCAPAARARRAVILGLLLLLSLLPLAARPEPQPDAVVEALFLCDPMPPSGRDLGVTLALEPGDGAGIALLPRMQLALALGDRLGLTTDVGVDAESGLHSPSASLKLLLREAAPGSPGVAASLDLLGGSHSLDRTEAGLGLGLVQPLGRLTLRASASVATPVAGWGPHLHAGASAAFAVGARWRFLCEAIAEAGEGPVAWSAGPAVKVALGPRSALAAGALFDLRAPSRPPSFVVQVTQGL